MDFIPEKYEQRKMKKKNKALSNELEHCRKERKQLQVDLMHKEHELAVKTKENEQNQKELQRIRELLDDAYHRLDATLIAAEVGIWVWDCDSNRVFADKDMIKIYGLDQEDVFGVSLERFLEQIHPDDRHRVLQALYRTIQSGELYEDEHRIKQADGSIKWVISRGRVTEREKDGKERTMIGILIDITSRKYAEETLVESEARFRGTFENGAVGITHIDMDGKLIRANRHFCKLIGYQCDELTQMTFKEITFPEDILGDAELTDRLIRGDIPYYHIDKRYVRKDNSMVWVTLTKSLQRDTAGRPLYTISIVQDITQRKRTEASLVESVKRFRTAIFAAPFPVMIHAEDGRILVVNDTWVELSGYTYADIPTIDEWTEKAFGRRKEVVKADIDHLYTIDDKLHNGEYRIRTAQGTERVWDFSSAPLGKDSEGNRLIISMAMDITTHKQAETKLHGVLGRLQRLVDANIFGTIVGDLSGNIFQANDYFLDLIGYTQEEIGKNQIHLCDLTPPEYRNADNRAIEELQRNGVCRPYEKQFIRKDGSRRWAMMGIATLPEEKKHIIAFVFNITARKSAEEALYNSESRFRQLADSMPQLVWTARADGTVDYYNNRYKEFGDIHVQADGTWVWQNAVYPDDMAATLTAWNHSIDTGQTYQIEHRLKHADGTYHWYLSRSVAIRNQNGKIVKWYCTATNIDKVKSTQQALEESQNSLKILTESLEEQVVKRTTQVRELAKALTLAEQRERQYLSKILHDDLQQILFSAKMRFDLLEYDIKNASPDVMEHVSEIKRLTEKALHTSRILAIEFNPPILKEEGLDAALKWLAHHMQTQHNLEVPVSITGNFRIIPEEERLLLIHFVRELLTNVSKHAHTAQVQLTVKQLNNDLVITVEDNGVGFDVEAVRKKQKENKHFGIFRIEERLHLIGGRLEIQSQPGKGTITRIIVPLPIIEDALTINDN